MTASWERADVFPIIARIIHAEYPSCGGRYLTHDEITSAILRDAEGSELIASARDQLGDEQSAEWIAHNMVAWFSQQITVGNSQWGQQFDRDEINGKWAYRPRISED